MSNKHIITIESEIDLKMAIAKKYAYIILSKVREREGTRNYYEINWV